MCSLSEKQGETSVSRDSIAQSNIQADRQNVICQKMVHLAFDVAGDHYLVC